MIRLFFLGLCGLLLSSTDYSPVYFDSLVEEFEKGYSALDLPVLSLSYVENLENAGFGRKLRKQELFFTEMEGKLGSIDPNILSGEERRLWEVMRYEVSLNIERIQLETRWQKERTSLKKTRIYDENMGKEWYAYFLKRWVDLEVEPDSIFQFGLVEIKKVKVDMKGIQDDLGLDDEAFIKYRMSSRYLLANKADVQAKYEDVQSRILANVGCCFPYLGKVPPVAIAPGDNEALAIAPAYYNQNTFYYNFFGETYDAKAMGWIYLHEAVPGHHYERSLNDQLEEDAVISLFFYPGYVEGWAAYVEQFGYELGAFEDPMDHYGQLEWDLVRSVRVALDVALNYYGWSDEEALEFWNEHIPDNTAVGLREIARMKRWPAQVVTYNFGKAILDDLKGDRISPGELKEFHREILDLGEVPVSVLKRLFA